MSVLSSPFELDASSVKIEIRPRIQGALALTAKKPLLGFRALRVRWNGAAAPGGQVAAVEIDPSTIFVVPGDIADSDRAKIEALARDELLAARAHPAIVYSVSAVETDPQGAVRLRGELVLRGSRAPLDLDFRREGGADVYRCELEVDLPQFGIKPPSAMLGALRCAERVPVAVEARLPSSA